MPIPQDVLARWASLEGVPSALAAARDGIDALLIDRGHRRTTPELTAESLLLGAVASSSLEGSQTGRDALRKGCGDDVAMSAVRLNAGLLALVPVVSRSPLQALARMHTLAATGLVDVNRLGRPRPVDGLAGRLQTLASWLLVPTAAPAIAVAAVAHAELLTINAFEGGNGLVARALERLILAAKGVDPTSVLVPEGGHAARGDDYRAALDAYAEGGLPGRRAWLLHTAEAITTSVELSPLR